MHNHCACVETLFEVFNMQGRHVRPVASQHRYSLFLWASELLHCNCGAQSLLWCFFYWFTFPRFFSLYTSEACLLALQCIWFSPWLQPDLTLRVHSRSGALTFLRSTFYIDCFEFFSLFEQCDVHICALPPALPTRPVTFRCFWATWLCISTLQNRHKVKIKLATADFTLSSQMGRSEV